MIRIERILIKNFKRFQSVDIIPAPGPGPLIFIGKNYLGKSNFLNAICWCLYEETPFKQSITAELKPNEVLLNLDSKAKKEFDKVLVEIHISEGGEKYIFKRTWTETQDSIFSVMRKDGNDWKGVPNPNFYLDMLLPKSLRKYFIFAGENLEEFYSSGFEKELKEGVWNVSGVTVLDKSVDHLNSIITELQREAGRDNPEIKSLEKEKAKLLDEQKEKKIRREEIEEEISGLKTLNVKYQEDQKKYAKVKTLIEKKEYLINNLGSIKEKGLREKKRFNSLLTEKAPFLYIREQLSEIYKKLCREEEAGRLPPDIQASFIEELQQKGVCICGRKINKSDGSYKKLSNLIAEVEPAAQKSFMLEDKFEIGKILREQLSLKAEFNRFLNDRATREVNKDEDERMLKEISDNLKKSKIQDVSNIENALENLNQKIEKFNQELGGLKYEISNNDTKLSNIDKSINSAISIREKNIDIKQKLVFIEESRDAAELVRKKLTNRIRKIISNKTDMYFKKLFWDRDNFEKIEFTEDYNLKVFEKGVITPKSQISTGEGKVLALATLLAIAELSGFDTVPIFFDAPLSNLGTGIKKDLLDILPSITPKKQLFIFSLDDPEILDFIKNKMDKKKVYKLKKDKKNKHSTIIQPYYEN